VNTNVFKIEINSAGRVSGLSSCEPDKVFDANDCQTVHYQDDDNHMQTAPCPTNALNPSYMLTIRWASHLLANCLINWFVSRICGQRLAPVIFPVRVSVILLFDVHCFSPFDGPIGEFGKSAPDATQHAVVLAAVKDAARR
jgi:hypothetical protein